MQALAAGSWGVFFSMAIVGVMTCDWFVDFRRAVTITTGRCRALADLFPTWARFPRAVPNRFWL